MRSVRTYCCATNGITSSRINDLYPPLGETNSDLDSIGLLDRSLKDNRRIAAGRFSGEFACARKRSD
jgi:hypothetical protein